MLFFCKSDGSSISRLLINLSSNFANTRISFNNWAVTWTNIETRVKQIEMYTREGVKIVEVKPGDILIYDLDKQQFFDNLSYLQIKQSK